MTKPAYLKTAMQIPWKGKDVPHIIIDICRKCNISCRACYNNDVEYFKPLTEIEKELKLASELRNLQSVLLVGGEPLLHPDIIEIIKLIRSLGLYVEMSSNVVLLDDEYAKKLSNAGLNFISMHIESGQTRPDLVENTAENRLKLRKEKALICTKYNIEPGIIITGYKDNQAEIKECMQLFFETPEITYYILTVYRDTENMGEIYGNTTCKMKSSNSNYKLPDNAFTMKEIEEIAGAYFNHSPFNFIGSTKDKYDARWISYRLITAVNKDGTISSSITLTPTIIEKLFVKIYRKFTGHYIFYVPPSSCKNKIQMFLNGIFGNKKNLIFLFKNLTKKFYSKIFLINTIAEVENGEVVRCRVCSDAKIKNGKIIPTCISDCIKDVNYLKD